jgi:hypothetical protein
VANRTRAPPPKDSVMLGPERLQLSHVRLPIRLEMPAQYLTLSPAL